MRALLLSGGTGTRLRPLTYSIPKQLVPVGNKPVLGHCLENIRDCGIEEVGVIVGPHAEQVAAVFGDGSAMGLRLTYLQQERPLGLAHCVTVAADFLGEEDFLMYLGDNVLTEGVAEAAGAFRADRPDAQVLVTKVANPSDYGVASLGADGRVNAVVEKPERPPSDLALIGVYFFTAAVHRAVRAIRPSRRGELEITDAIGELIATGGDVRALEYTGFWRDSGTVEGLLDCNRAVLDTLRRDVRGSVDRHSVLTGDVVLAEGVEVVRSQLTGPVTVAAGTVVRDSRLGPYTSVGPGCTLDSTGIENSIVLEGTTITGVRGLDGSLIGRRAELHAEPAAASQRLIVGDLAKVRVAR
ncbi:glucose-1-phosphate thymidylylransferase long form [Kitasatospora sp. Ki12]|nr:glucose-1-phosphate thymidylyltransferase [Kitasatospora xanthocidica]